MQAVGPVLVTGASGFIGHHLVDALLEHGLRVRALSRSRPGPAGAQTVLADLGDLSAVQEAARGVDIIVHLGGVASVDAAAAAPMDTFRVNTLGTQNVLEAARVGGASRVVLLSTAHVYGRPIRLPLCEEHPLAPQSHYAATKLAADVLAAGYRQSYGLGTTVLRPMNVYGPGQGEAAVIPTIIAKALTRGRISVRNPAVTRDFVFVDDVVAAILAAIAAPSAVDAELLLASGRPVTVAAIMQHVAVLTGAHIEGLDGVGIENGDCIYGSARRARERLGWVPKIDLDEGLARTVAWWRERVSTVAALP